MEWILLVALLFLLIGLVFMFPSLLAPRCPICAARLQPHEYTHTWFEWRDWQVCWRRYICPQCLFRQDYLRVARKDTKHETRPVH